MKTTMSKRGKTMRRTAITGERSRRTGGATGDIARSTALSAFLATVVVLWATSTVPARTTEPSPAPAEQAKYTRAAILPVTGTISDVTLDGLRRRVETAKENGADLIVFEMNTPGGLVDSAIDICDFIKNQTDVHTVAWVNTQAYSAGSMISVACDEIVMAPASVLGDCGVIMATPGGGATEVPAQMRAKVESPVIEQFRDSAARRGYNQLLCESMVVREKVAYWVENLATGERRFVTPEVKNQLLEVTSNGEPIGDSEGSKTWRLVGSFIDPTSGRAHEVVQPVVPDTELLTMSQSRASAFGFCADIVGSDKALMARYGLSGQTPMRLAVTWSESLTGWLTSMPVRAFLLVLVLLGAYVEFNTPGVGVGGLVALICLAVFIGAPYLTGLANVWEVILIGIGLGLIALEIFVIPGFGIAGISGLAFLLLGLLFSFIPDEPGRSFPIFWPSLESTSRAMKLGLLSMGASMVVSIVGMVGLSRVIPRIPWLRGVVHTGEAGSVAGGIIALDEDPYLGYAKIGDVGTLETPLRPSGKARFGPVLVDVVSQGDFLEPPGQVEVVERNGNRVVVRPVG